MVPMKRRTAIAVTVGVWIAALGSAAGLEYDLNGTPHFASAHLANVTSQPATPLAAASQASAPAAAEMQPVLYIPTITIVGSMRRLVVPEPKPPVAPDISKMQCADWRELDMGSGHVQVCQ
jgi:hypothetical protein